MKKITVSIVIPVFNEHLCLDELIDRCLQAGEKSGHQFELILIDDGSSDGSDHKITEAAKRYLPVVAVLLNRNYGQHAAIFAGLSVAQGNIIVTLDADLQNPPEEIPRLIQEIEKGNDVVGTMRMHRQDSFFRRIASAVVNKAVRQATGVMMHDYGCMLRAYRRFIIDAMLQCSERSTFIPILANSFAGTTSEISVKHDSRNIGTSKYSLLKLVSLQFDLLTSMSTFPLRLLSIIGLFVAGGGIGFGLLIAVMRIYYGSAWAADGVFSLFAAMFILIGSQFIALGLLGEYIGRIYQDVRARPRYFIREITGHSTKDTDPPFNPLRN